MAETFLQAIGAAYNYDLGSGGWKNGVDRNFVLLDTFAMPHVINDDLLAEPGAPSVGDAYVLPSGTKTGTNWGTDSGAVTDRIAIYTNIPGQTDDSPWVYIPPKEGWMLYDRQSNEWRFYNGTSWGPGELVTYQFSASDLTTALAAATSVGYLRAPRAFTVTDVRASLLTAGTTASTFDINVNGSTILSTKLTIDANEKTSETAATPAVISAASISDDDEITADIDTAGTNAAGLIITLIGGASR